MRARPCVVFTRGVNVGGHRRFSPSALARKLTALHVACVQAAGTFVVRRTIGRAALRAAFRRELPFEAEQGKIIGVAGRFAFQNQVSLQVPYD